jgi:hypothetical protein
MLVALADSHGALAPSDKQRLLPNTERVFEIANRYLANADLAPSRRETGLVP